MRDQVSDNRHKIQRNSSAIPWSTLIKEQIHGSKRIMKPPMRSVEVRTESAANHATACRCPVDSGSVTWIRICARPSATMHNRIFGCACDRCDDFVCALLRWKRIKGVAIWPHVTAVFSVSRVLAFEENELTYQR